MIKQIFLEGFKSFAEPTHVDVNELLTITGSNSGGKSTILQALLLLSQTLDNPRSDVVLDLGGKYVQFAEFREAVFGRPKTKDASFSIGFNIDILENDISSKSFYVAKLLALQPSKIRASNILIDRRINKVRIEFNFGADPSGKPQINFSKYIKTIDGLGEIEFRLEKFRGKYRTYWEINPSKELKESKLILSESIENRLSDLNIFVSDKKKGSYAYLSSRHLLEIFSQAGFELLDIPEFGIQLREFINTKYRELNTDEIQDPLAEILRDICIFSFQRGFADSFLQHLQFDHFLMPASTRTIGPEFEVSKFLGVFFSTFGEAVKDVRSYLRKIQYIGPLRARPERAYLSTGTPVEIGNAGENAISILWQNQNEKVTSKTKIGEESSEKRLLKAVQDWLQEFEIAYSFHITKPKRVIYQAEIESYPGSKTMVTIADVGFGVSQLLPVIIAGLRAGKGSTLILEQPEIHLHPRLQGKLADFLICMIELGKKVIVETHSEHLINMLRLRIIQDKTGDLQHRIGIIFVRNWQKVPFESLNLEKQNKKGSCVENLRVDQYGKIINWPSDFFPETSRLNEEILKAILDKYPES